MRDALMSCAYCTWLEADAAREHGSVHYLDAPSLLWIVSNGCPRCYWDSVHGSRARNFVCSVCTVHVVPPRDWTDPGVLKRNATLNQLRHQDRTSTSLSVLWECHYNMRNHVLRVSLRLQKFLFYRLGARFSRFIQPV